MVQLLSCPQQMAIEESEVKAPPRPPHLAVPVDPTPGWLWPVKSCPSVLQHPSSVVEHSQLITEHLLLSGPRS